MTVRLDVTVASGQVAPKRLWPSIKAGTPIDMKVVLDEGNRLWLIAALEGPPTPPGYELLPGRFSLRSSPQRLGIHINKDAVADLASQLAPVFPDHRILFRLFPRLATGKLQFRDPGSPGSPHCHVRIAL